METKTNTNQNPDKSRKVIRIVISILVAIALWVYVDRGLSVEVTMKVNNVPVEFSGEDTSLAEKNLMLLSGYDTTIDLTLKGPPASARRCALPPPPPRPAPPAYRCRSKSNRRRIAQWRRGQHFPPPGCRGYPAACG